MPCNQLLQQSGVAHPRTCQVCGLGPCHNNALNQTPAPMPSNMTQIWGEGTLQLGSEGAAAYDLTAQHGAVVPAGGRCLIKTGVHVRMPRNMCAEVLSRSGLALKHGVFVLNAPGLIDPDYEGEIGVILFNSGTADFDVHVGDRIAQLKFSEFKRPSFVILYGEVGGVSARGEGGFGSTGTQRTSDEIRADTQQMNPMVKLSVFPPDPEKVSNPSEWGNP